MTPIEAASPSPTQSRHAAGRVPDLFMTAMLMTMMLAAAPAARADEASAAVRIERVALFKNGLGFFSSRATLPADATAVELGELPVPAHGSLWVEYGRDTPVRGVFSRIEQVTRERPVGSIEDLLAANLGRSVTLEPGSISGELLSVQPALALVRSRTGTVAVHPGSLERALIAGDQVRSAREVETERTVLRLELDRPAGGAEVALSYLAKGISWAPSYLIDLSDPQTARFSAKAVVVNEAVDLEDVALDLVTGFPNLRFAEVASPMAAGQTLESFFRALRQRQMPRAEPSVLVQQRLVQVLPPGSQPGPAYSTAIAGRASEDLFLYPVPRLTLRRGERASLPLISAEMPYEHVYTWEIPDFLDPRQRYGQQEDTEREEEVWHACRLTNTAGVPLTTAPAQFVRDGQVVGQDVAGYTLPGTATTIRINRALGLVADQAEFETGRERQAVHLHGKDYDRIDIRGELKLRNMLGKPARVEVTKSLSGELGEISDDPRRTRTAKGLRAANSSHRLLWTLDLEAGEEKSISYEYTVLVRH